MSRNRPSLRDCPKGYASAKFNGRKINFGRFDDPDAQGRFDSFRACWPSLFRGLLEEAEAALK